MSSPLKIITTEDGSHSLYNAELNETYHSFHGAIQESKHVFIKSGLEFINQSQPETIRVFEVGFGTGLNALLTAELAFEKKVKVEMTSIEAYPISKELIENLNYSERINNPNANAWFNAIHNCEWGSAELINDHFTLVKIHDKLENYSITQNSYDVIYFDAFAPNKQEEMWSIELLQNVANGMALNGCLVTYCAQGQLKRNLKSLGLEVETLPGPPGKKEMVRAILK